MILKRFIRSRLAGLSSPADLIQVFVLKVRLLRFSRHLPQKNWEDPSPNDDDLDRDDPDRDDNDDDGCDEVWPRMVSIGSLQRRQTAAGLKITRTTKKGQKYQN